MPIDENLRHQIELCTDADALQERSYRADALAELARTLHAELRVGWMRLADHAHASARPADDLAAHANGATWWTALPSSTSAPRASPRRPRLSLIARGQRRRTPSNRGRR